MWENGMSLKIKYLLEHLGISQTYLAVNKPEDVEELCKEFPDMVAGIAFVAAFGFKPAFFTALGERAMFLQSEFGKTKDSAEAAKLIIKGLKVREISNYEALPWSNIGADRKSDLCNHIVSFFKEEVPSIPDADIVATEGEFNNISYSVIGAGPPLVLGPLGLAPDQWNPILDQLKNTFTLIIVTGADLGSVQTLEHRAELPGYRAMLDILAENMKITEIENLVEVGCGTGAICRQFLERNPKLTMVGTDINRYLLKEGSNIASKQNIKVSESTELGIEKPIDLSSKATLTFGIADATNLPFPENTFDGIYSVTALEECDAKTALAEFFRVIQPNKAAGVIVRARDIPVVWNLDLPNEILRKISLVYQNVTNLGIADKSLLDAMQKVGFKDNIYYPFMVTASDTENGTYEFFHNRARQLLNEVEVQKFDEATQKAKQDEQSYVILPHHCCIGWK